MNFEWDEHKSELCFEERGFDFAYAAQAFFDPHRMVRADLRFDYGEQRFMLLGEVQGRLFSLVYTPRTHAVRIISARKANAREAKLYENHPRPTQSE